MESRFSFALLFLAACQAQAPRPRTDIEIKTAVGVDQEIELRVDGLPVDEEAEPGDALSLAEALALGLESSPEIQIALARVRASIAEADQARLLPNPLLEFVLRFPEGGGSPDVEVGLATDLLAILRRDSAAAIADSQLSAAVSDAVATSVSVAADVQEQYARVRTLDELVPLSRARLEDARRRVALERSRVDFGEASRADLATVEARALELEIEVAENESRLREERLALARRIGRPSDEAAWTLEALPEAPAAAGEERAWVALALEQRAELQAHRRRLEALGLEARIASSPWQVLDVGVRAERGDGWSTGPSVKTALPLFDDGSARGERAEALALQALDEWTHAQRQVIEDVRRAYAALASARASLARVRDELVPLQQSRREQVEAAHRAGQVDVGAVLLADEDLGAARARLVEAAQRAFVAQVRLERAVGGAGVAREVVQ